MTAALSRHSRHDTGAPRMPCGGRRPRGPRLAATARGWPSACLGGLMVSVSRWQMNGWTMGQQKAGRTEARRATLGSGLLSVACGAAMMCGGLIGCAGAAGPAGTLGEARPRAGGGVRGCVARPVTLVVGSYGAGHLFGGWAGCVPSGRGGRGGSACAGRGTARRSGAGPSRLW